MIVSRGDEPYNACYLVDPAKSSRQLSGEPTSIFSLYLPTAITTPEFAPGPATCFHMDPIRTTAPMPPSYSHRFTTSSLKSIPTSSNMQPHRPTDPGEMHGCTHLASGGDLNAVPRLPIVILDCSAVALDRLNISRQASVFVESVMPRVKGRGADR
ncbi:hypothetical protein EIP86_007399 [Pleurotus ostreatoroseus]|nr:hypothetical protein EIP86_007399 [Pleurotus ostreatoroseus]